MAKVPACSVTASADINQAAKSISFSNYPKAGQTWLFGIEVLIDPSVHETFLEKASYWIDQSVKDEGQDHAARILTARNHDGLFGLFNRMGGKMAQDIPQTVVTDVNMHRRYKR